MHFDAATEARAPWRRFEVHAGNDRVAGGSRIGWLMTIRDRHEISIHGVGLSLAADESPSKDHLHPLHTLIERVHPALDVGHLT